MPMPPKKPLNKNGENSDYFNYLLATVADSVETDEFYLDFTGYDELIASLQALQPDNYQAAWELSMECNAWSEYFADCIANIHRIYRDLETDKIAIISSASNDADKKSVSNGDRLANKDELVIQARKRRNRAEALLKALESKQTFLDRSHYFCKTTAEHAAKQRNSEQ